MINKGLYFFIIGSFIGWILEIVFKIISKEDVVRAGMANGPFCILYGIGTFVLAMVISKYTKNVFLIFLFSSIILTSLEYVTGLLLDKVYEVELWDYSKLKFGINKYISLEFMIIWGVLGVIFIKYILPNLNKIYIYLDGPILITMIYIATVYIFIDYLYTSIKILSMK